jgi:heme a synthase
MIFTTFNLSLLFFMLKPTSFYQYCFFVLVNIFLVIIAGSVVRTTQSGMGCPDWPKCFGQYIPPTSMEQVVFNANKTYNKGQFVKHNDSLWSAKTTFVSSTNFNVADWKHYSKHGYTKIVIYQTWIEYINRLLGALLGLFIFIQVIWSFRLRKTNPSLFIWSIVLLILTGFQAWLGKTVVDSNLAVIKISIHLAGAVAMLLVQLFILHRLYKVEQLISRKIVGWLYALATATVIQFFMGIAVRQKVDEVSEFNSFLNRANWLTEVGNIYYVHRSFSLLIFLGFFMFYFRFKKELNFNLYKIVLLTLLLQLGIGIIFNYAHFPALVQPLHLFLSSVLLSALFVIFLRKKSIA